MPLPLLAVADDAPVGTLPAKFCASHRGCPRRVIQRRVRRRLSARPNRMQSCSTSGTGTSVGSPPSSARRIPWPGEGRSRGCGSRAAWPWRSPLIWCSCWPQWRQRHAGGWQ